MQDPRYILCFYQGNLLKKRKMDPEKKIELIKWFLGSFVLVLITTVISFHFQDRQQSLSEVTFYDKYATDLIVLNPDVAKRRLLAQYFAHVTPNPKVREQWMSYYKIVNDEWIKSEGGYNFPPRAQSQSDSSEYPYEEYSKETVGSHLEFVLPDSKYQSASDLERLGWESLLEGKKDDALFYFRRCEDIYPGFHSIWEVIKLLETDKSLSLEEIKSDLKKLTWKIPIDLRRRVESM